jgi:hypothetical protein
LSYLYIIVDNSKCVKYTIELGVFIHKQQI